MESKLSDDEKKKIFNVTVQAAITVMNSSNPPHDKDGNNLAHLAAKYNMEDAVMLLANKAAHLFLLPNAEGQVALMQIASQSSAELFDAVKCLIPGLDLTVTDNNGNNLAHFALYNTRILSAIIKSKPELFDKPDKKSRTPIHSAVANLDDIISFDPSKAESKNLASLVNSFILLSETFPALVQNAIPTIRDSAGRGLGHHLVRFVMDYTNPTEDDMTARLAILTQLVKNVPSLFETLDNEGRKATHAFYTRGTPVVEEIFKTAMEEKRESADFNSKTRRFT